MTEHQFHEGDRVYMRPHMVVYRQVTPRIRAQIEANLGTVVGFDQCGDPYVKWDTKPHHGPSLYRAARLTCLDAITALGRVVDD